MASSTEVEQPLKLKKSSVVVLKVSIHCEGCKRKVKKLLQSLPGVDDIEIERLQQRVVVTGDVTPQTLITKLVKSGKNAQLWPQKPPQVVQESVMSGNSPPIPAPDPSKVNTTNIPSDKVDEVEKLQVEVKVEGNKPETGNTPSPTTVVEKKEQQSDNSGSGGDDGEAKKKKKKKKKGQSSNKSGNIGETSSNGPSQDIDSGPMPTSTHSNQTHQGYQYALPRHNYTPPPAPVYTMSYNTAHPPVNTYTTSYYAPSPPPQAYAYSHFGSEMPPPPNVPQPTQSYGYTQFGYDMALQPSVPTGYESYRQPSTGDSFEMFSDENPNGCSVM